MTGTKRLFLFFQLFLTGFLIEVPGTMVYAQHRIEGYVTNIDKRPLGNVSVTLLRLPGQSILDYGFTDTTGYYKFNTVSELDSLILMVSGFNIGIYQKRIKNEAQRIDFEVKEEAVKMKEVLVQAPKIWENKDTINYSVNSFSDKNDDVIEDVLKKLPGITVTAEGKIEYQGKPINKFYIENMDLLQGRYSLATRNISAKDISTVQIYEGHQPIRALQDISPSDKAAINLKLKEGVKGVWIITARLGLGVAPDQKKQPALWDHTLLGMLFTRKMQNMSVYKGNNSGSDVYQELVSHNRIEYFDSDEMVWVKRPSPPAIKLNRYLFNNTNAIAVNNLTREKRETI